MFGISDVERAQILKHVNSLDINARHALRERLKAASNEEHRKLLKEIAGQ